eukprot:CAMPEP_0177635564 /NCGR_PEP_ID=MMETSP0447-20121125/3971_1 /TAXON_ID=0 /ORGANISM="Stygamoeba regulata, Strain BSH-02190019" /LENGTH=387 /DNA_ID=CAMNT_0019137365 /DNA_START=321 /DNA_END=1480 /DNA_ORIENTATION=+
MDVSPDPVTPGSPHKQRSSAGGLFASLRRKKRLGPGTQSPLAVSRPLNLPGEPNRALEVRRKRHSASISTDEERLGENLMKMLLISLKANDNNLVSVCLDDMPLGKKELKKLADVLRYNKVVSSLSIQNSIKNGDNNISILMSALLENHTLTSLDISKNHLTAKCIPVIEGVMKVNMSLTDLRMANQQSGDLSPLMNNINEYLQGNIDFSKFKAGEWDIVDMSGRGWKELHPFLLSQSHRVQEIDVSSNNIPHLPNSLQEFILLRFLDVSSNNLTCLPQCIGSLPLLQTLDVSHNRITDDGLPDSLRLLPLRYLDISHNRLTQIPNYFAVMNLDIFRVNNNHIKNVPREVLDQGDYKLITYLKEIIAGGVKRCYRTKLMVVGNANVG